MSELRKIPNIGKTTENDLIKMGYTTIESLKGKKAEELYLEECTLRGMKIDRCQLYVYRALEYFVNNENPNPNKCKWWYFKDETFDPSPCGSICYECERFPNICAGCRNIEGKVFWLEYTGDKCCKVYECNVNKKKQKDCSNCKSFPCDKFSKDPTISDEQNEENLKKLIKNLKK